jgi:enoyl-[acyl-carrier protein] reductase II
MHKFSGVEPMRDLTTGDLSEMALLAGQGVGLVRSIASAARVVADTTTQARAPLLRYRSRR